MFSLEFGKPIAKVSENGKCQILGLVDPDDKETKKELEKKIIKKKHIKKIIKKCCKYHSNKYCEFEDCCDKCPFSKSDSESESEEEKKIKIPKLDKTFFSKCAITPLPDLEADRFVIYCAGPSGSGKSTISSELACQFKKAYPKASIIIFSRTDTKQDKAYDKLKPKQIKLTNDLVEHPIDITKELNENEPTLAIFDDCETIMDPKLNKTIEKLIIDSCICGRKLRLSLIITNHLVIPQTDRHFARNLLNEITHVFLFPHSGSWTQCEYALKTYWGLGKNETDKIFNLPNTRWVEVSKGFPRFVLSAHSAYIL
jgi:hypothetical protein